MRSRSSPVLVQEAAEQVASTYPALLICHADGGQTGAWVRCFQPKRLVRAMLVAGSARGAVPAFRRARFPGPPPEPGVPVIPAPGSPRGPLPTTVAPPPGSAVPGLDCQARTTVFTGDSCPADSPPQPRRAPLPCGRLSRTSDYYGHSATTRHQQQTTHLPAAPRRGGRRRVASHVHHQPVDECGAQLYPDSLARGTPQPFPLASSPATTYRLRSRSPPSRRACTADRPRSARLEPARRLRSVNAGSSRTPSRLACRTRAVWQYRPVPAWSGLLPPSRASPRSGCPQLHRPAATGQRRGPSIPARSW